MCWGRMGTASLGGHAVLELVVLRRRLQRPGQGQPQRLAVLVRQLRHHLGPSLMDFCAFYRPTHAVYGALFGYHAYWMLIGACDPMI